MFYPCVVQQPYEVGFVVILERQEHVIWGRTRGSSDRVGLLVFVLFYFSMVIFLKRGRYELRKRDF